MALNDKQQVFVDNFCELLDAGVSESDAYAKAKELADYSVNTSRRSILSDDVVEAIRAHYNQKMVLRLSKASNGLDSLLDDPAQDGAAVLLGAVNTTFDRGGVIKKETKEVVIKAPTGVVVLPPKATPDQI